MPERIQLRRVKGWRKPVGAVVVSRPSKWGNPFRVGDAVTGYPYSELCPVVADAETAVRLFRARMEITAGLVVLARAELAGKDLACWCPVGSACHADVLLEFANG